MKNRIRMLRLVNGLSQRTLADRVGITRPMISLFEHWRRDPSLALAYRLADALGKSIDEVFPHERQTFPSEETKATTPEPILPSKETARLSQNQVRASRVTKCWSQRELAERVGVASGTIAAIERGYFRPSLALAYAISQVLGASVLDLFPLGAFRKVPPLEEDTVPTEKDALNPGALHSFPPDVAVPMNPEGQSKGDVD
jgi:putative transcriptional regulator